MCDFPLPVLSLRRAPGAENGSRVRGHLKSSEIHAGDALMPPVMITKVRGSASTQDLSKSEEV